MAVADGLQPRLDRSRRVVLVRRPRGQQVAIVVGITAFGFAFAVGLLYVWHVLRAPYRQRDEARQWVRDLRAEMIRRPIAKRRLCRGRAMQG